VEPPSIGMSEGVLAAANILREFMFQRVYLWEGRREEAERAKRVVRFLFQYYLSRPEEIRQPSSPQTRPGGTADYVR
jgi:dGTPase